MGRINNFKYSIGTRGSDAPAGVLSKKKKKLMKSVQSQIEFFKTGTMFLKYCNNSKPKQRLVYLNKEETAIMWKTPNSKEKPRQILVKDILAVSIGLDDFQKQLKRNYPVEKHLDNFCLTILTKGRSLDLLHTQCNAQDVQLWETKIQELIDKRLKPRVSGYENPHDIQAEAIYLVRH